MLSLYTAELDMATGWPHSSTIVSTMLSLYTAELDMALGKLGMARLDMNSFHMASGIAESPC